MLVKMTKIVNMVTFGIVFSFCFILDIVVCLLTDLMVGDEITNVSLMFSFFTALIIALILHLLGRFRIYEINNYHEKMCENNRNKIIDLGNTKFIYKDIISALGYQKAFVCSYNGKMYFIGNKFYAYKMCD